MHWRRRPTKYRYYLWDQIHNEEDGVCGTFGSDEGRKQVILVKKHEGKRIGRTKRMWGDNIKVDIKEI